MDGPISTNTSINSNKTDTHMIPNYQSIGNGSRGSSPRSNNGMNGKKSKSIDPDKIIQIDTTENTTEITDNQVLNITNNWSESNATTLRNWKQSLSKASFIYQYVLEGSKTTLNRVMMTALLLSTISTVISGISTMALTVDKPTYKLIALIINIVLFVISALLSFLNGAVKIYKWDEIVASYTSYIEKMDQIYSVIASQLVLPPNLREDALTFIKNQSETYLNLIRQSPDIDSSLYRTANKAYAKFLQDDGVNFKCSQKYKNDDSIIDVV